MVDDDEQRGGVDCRERLTEARGVWWNGIRMKNEQARRFDIEAKPTCPIVDVRIWTERSGDERVDVPRFIRLEANGFMFPLSDGIQDAV